MCPSPCAQDHLCPNELVPSAGALTVDLDCVGSVPRPSPIAYSTSIQPILSEPTWVPGTSQRLITQGRSSVRVPCSRGVHSTDVKQEHVNRKGKGRVGQRGTFKGRDGLLL